MRKKVLLFFMPAIIMAFSACVITVEEDASHVIIYAGNSSLGFRITNISDVNYLKLTVSADDIDTISRVFTGPEIRLDITPGPSRTFKLEAFDSADRLLFYGSSGADLYPGETLTLKITMQEALYKIIFDKQGGAGGTDSVMAEYDAAMPPAIAPARAGYSFAGYFDATSGGTQYYLADMTSAKNWDRREDTILYAQWNPLYTFTTAGATGRQGPSQSQIDAAYSGTNLEGTVTATATGIQMWAVPYTGTYRIIAYGASGANAATYGRGAKIQADFYLTQSETLFILVGQKGEGQYKAYAHIGGGGGSFVSKGSSLATSTLLVVAGGGGAAGANANASSNGQATLDGGAGYHDSNDGTNTANNGGGTGGAQGAAGDQTGMDSAAGINKTSTTDPNEAKRFFDGGLGSLVVSGTYNGDGGFGGGGAKIANTGGYATAGGGGGYSGGGASDGTNGMPFYGGGGGSYIDAAGINQLSTAGGAPVGDGKVEIIYLGP